MKQSSEVEKQHKEKKESNNGWATNQVTTCGHTQSCWQTV